LPEVILLDTHVWVWWVHGDQRLSKKQASLISENEEGEIGVSIISCWEVAKLVEYGRLKLPRDLTDWFAQALSYPGVVLIQLTPEIVVDSVQLPGTFHRDPADQLIVATARLHRCHLLTSDEKITRYPHVQTVP